MFHEKIGRRSFLIGAGALVAAPAIVRASSLMPVRALRDLGPPPPWILCDGRTLSPTRYGELFRAIGTFYGAGDGLTTFQLPDMRAATKPLTGMKYPEYRAAVNTIGPIPAGSIYPFLSP